MFFARRNTTPAQLKSCRPRGNTLTPPPPPWTLRLLSKTVSWPQLYTPYPTSIPGIEQCWSFVLAYGYLLPFLLGLGWAGGLLARGQDVPDKTSEDGGERSTHSAKWEVLMECWRNLVTSHAKHLR